MLARGKNLRVCPVVVCLEPASGLTAEPRIKFTSMKRLPSAVVLGNSVGTEAHELLS